MQQQKVDDFWPAAKTRNTSGHSERGQGHGRRQRSGAKKDPKDQERKRPGSLDHEHEQKRPRVAATERPMSCARVHDSENIDEMQLSQTQTEAVPEDHPLSVESDDEASGMPLQSRSEKKIQIANCGQVSLPAILWRIIDTPHFQSLRHKKQLGTADLVFPSSTHTRFEHSIGVAHKAERVLQQIEAQRRESMENMENNGGDMWWKDEKRYPHAGADEQVFPPHIPPLYRLCVLVAALVHDLGHGPFSHVFQKLPKKLFETRQQSNWRHERQTVLLFRDLVREYGIVFSLDPAKHEEALDLVQDMVLGDKLGHAKKKSEALESRTVLRNRKDLWFLYDIVANAGCGLDVDKLDYFCRDSGAALGEPIHEIIDKFVDEARVCWVKDGDGRTCIAWGQKHCLDAPSLFGIRNNMHRKVYQHRKIFPCEEMVVEIFSFAFKAHVHLSISDASGERTGWRDINAAFDQNREGVEVFLKLDDRFLQLLDNYNPPAEVLEGWKLGGVSEVELVQRAESLAAAKRLLRCLDRRDTMRFVGELFIPPKEVEGGLKSRLENAKATPDFIAMVEAVLRETKWLLPADSALSDAEKQIDLEDLMDADIPKRLALVLLKLAEEAKNEERREEKEHGLPEEDREELAVQRAARIEQRLAALEQQFREQFRETAKALNNETLVDDLVLNICTWDHGQGAEDPVSKMRFFGKDARRTGRWVATRVDPRTYEATMPKQWQSYAFRVYCKAPSKINEAADLFWHWQGRHRERPRTRGSDILYDPGAGPGPARAAGKLPAPRTGL